MNKIGHYGTVSNQIKPLQEQWEKQVASRAEITARGMTCNSNTKFPMSGGQDAYSGVNWIGGFWLSQSADCSVSVICKEIGGCSPTQVKLFKYKCGLDYGMHDLFEYPSDLDNTGGTDFWDKWNYFGTPFYVDGAWSSEITGGGQL